ncbi:MAG: hypothetical protein D6782_03585 [Alphaproteobacteria bacterium]|nr:MAG: hypothetical protein D6782_03585 [Alphaproteobacteria bacterium]
MNRFKYKIARHGGKQAKARHWGAAVAGPEKEGGGEVKAHSSHCRHCKKALFLSGAIFIGLPAVHAHAQVERRASALEEIVVTAQKREENLQTVPIAVSALNATQIERSFARDILDIESMSPNLIIDPILGNGTAAISIRGMQLNDVEKSFDPAVAVYQDGIYLATTTGALLNVWDAEAVEVLRGPQGTLFGRNTIGGLLHIRRAKPTGEAGVKATFTYGRFEQFDAKGAINLPGFANDTLKAKLSYVVQTGGGYFRNAVRDKDEGNTDFFSLTTSLLWTPSENFEAWLVYDYIDDTTPTRPVTALTSPGELFCNPFVTLAGCGQPASNARFHRRPTTTSEQKAFLETHAITLNANWDVADNQQMVAVVGYRTTDEDALQEFDGVEADLFRTQRPQNLDQFSAELRWQANWFDDRAKTVFGLFYWNSEYDLRQSTTSFAFFGPPQVSGIESAQAFFDQDTDSFAIFGQVDVDIVEDVILSLGGRWINERKKACGLQGTTFVATGFVPVVSYGFTGFENCQLSVYAANAVDPVTAAVTPQDGKERWKDFTPRVALAYNFDNETTSGMVYASYSEGFRSGGFNGRSTNAFSLGPYDPEKVEAFEAGFKTQWLDDRLRVNVTGFLTDYNNKQEDVVFPDPQQVTVTVVQNAASASIDGIEAEIVALPVQGLTLSAVIGYLDSGFKEWTVRGLDGNPVDKSNFELRRAPDWTVTLNGAYEYELPNGDFLVFTANYAWKDDYFIIANTVTFADPNPGLVKSYGLLDASINYDAGKWRLSVFGKNLTKSNVFQHVLDVGTNFNAVSAADPTPVPIPGLWTFGTINAPTLWGVELGINF